MVAASAEEFSSNDGLEGEFTMSINRRGFLNRSGAAAAGIASIGAGIAAAARPASAMVQDSPVRNIKITGYKVRVINNIDPPVGARHWIFLQLFTDAGIVGLGERVSGQTGGLQSQVNLIGEMCEQAVVGSSPFDVEAIWHKIYTQPHDYRSPSLTSTPALSAIEMALWEIMGKATGQPVYNLLGGKFRGGGFPICCLVVSLAGLAPCGAAFFGVRLFPRTV